MPVLSKTLTYGVIVDANFAKLRLPDMLYDKIERKMGYGLGCLGEYNNSNKLSLVLKDIFMIKNPKHHFSIV